MTDHPRPPAVTTASLFVGLSCLILLGNVVTWLTDWGSLDIQNAITTLFGGERSLQRSGLSMTEALLWGRRALLVATVVLIAGVVFAVFTARGHRASRVSLTIMCALVGLGFAAVGGLIGLLAAAFAIMCAVQLWSRDARAWFDAKSGIGPVPAAPATGTSPATAFAPVSGAALPASSRHPRPASVQVAGIVTIIASWAVIAAGSLIIAQYLTAREAMLQAQKSSPIRNWVAMTDSELAEALHTVVVISAVAVPLSLLAVAAASLLLMGRPVGRTATLALAVITVPVSFASVIGLPWTAAAIVVIIALRKPEAQAWFDDRRHGGAGHTF